MRIAPLVPALLAAALVVAGCAGSGEREGSPVTGDGRPDGQGGTTALEFRHVLDAQPAVPGDEATPPGSPATARDRRQSTDESVQQAELAALDCADDPLRGAGGLHADRPLVACAADETEKFLLDATTLTGEDVANAVAQGDQHGGGGWLVMIDFTEAGTRKWTELTEQAVGERVAFTIRGTVVSSPTVNEPIRGGSTQIAGNFTQADAEDLVRQITGG